VNSVTTPKLPPPIRLVLRVGLDDGAVGEHHGRPAEVVDREPERAAQVPDAAAERQPADTGRADDADRHGQAVLVRRVDQILEQRAAADAHRRRGWIDGDLVDL